MTDETKGAQAPTPGPLSAQQEEAIAFNLCSLHGFDPIFVTTQRDFAFAVIREYERARPSLAPTAPVEASGSEREAVSRIRDHLGVLAPTETMARFCVSDIRSLLAALRPQPSGEARDAVALQIFADEVAKTGVTEDTSGDDAYNALTVIVEYARQLSTERPDPEASDGDLNGHLFRDPIKSAEALIRPAPVASGGQHSSGEGEQ